MYNPLTLLLAVGNGQGGGDYDYDDCGNRGVVGRWAFNRLAFVDKSPELIDKKHSPVENGFICIGNPFAILCNKRWYR